MALKLMLADESITIKKVVMKIFSQADFEVATVQDGSEILATAQRFKPDVVLLSTTLAGNDLQSKVSEISRLSTNPNAVILLGNRGNGIDSSKSQQLGAGGLVFKPLDNRELQKAIDAILQDPEPAPTAAKAATGAGLVTPSTSGDIDQRAKILFEVFESYFNENMVILTDSLTKALVPKVAAEVSSRVIESMEMTELPKQIMNMTRGIVSDLVPQIAERVITREVELIKEEAIRLIEAEEDDNA